MAPLAKHAETPRNSTTHRHCVRCGLLATLDRCGWCRFCQYELAHKRPYIAWKLLPNKFRSPVVQP